MSPRYLFDTGLSTNLPKEFYRWWKTYYAFPGSPFENIKVRVVNDTNRTLENFFIRKKPSRELLKKDGSNIDNNTSLHQLGASPTLHNNNNNNSNYSSNK